MLELRQYWVVISSRWWVIVLLTALALGVSMVNAPRSVGSYKASVRLAVRPETTPPTSTYYTYDGYYAYVASEYLNDDVGKIVESSAFMDGVRQRATSEQGRAPSGSFEVKKAHRVLMVDATSGSAEDALLLTRTAADMLSDPKAPYFGLVSDEKPTVSVVDAPAITMATPASRVWVDVSVRSLLGLLVGVVLAFLLDFLDNSIRGRDDLESITGLVILGEIPR